MSENCSLCGQKVSPESFNTLLVRHQGWWEWQYESLNTPVTLDSGLVVTKVHEFSEHYDGDAFMVFQIGERYFRKDGYESSFGGSHWNGEFREVSPKLKTVYDYN